MINAIPLIIKEYLLKILQLKDGQLLNDRTYWQHKEQ